MQIEQITTRQYAENVWLVGDPATRRGLIIDPGDQPDQIIRTIGILRLTPLAILNTHGHPDHLGAAAELQRHFGVPFYIHENEKPSLNMAVAFGQMLGLEITALPEKITYFRKDGEIELSPFVIKMIETPGHTPGSVCYLIENVLFSGDTLFQASVGRVDFPGGSWPELQQSLTKLKTLPPETLIYPGHGATTTLARELNSNPYLK